MTAAIRPISHQSTNDKVFALIRDSLHPAMRVLDLGAGEGYFSQVVGEYVRTVHGGDPAQVVSACDVTPSIFRYDAIRCLPIGADNRIPYPDATFDIVCSIEVVEHVEDQFGYCREILRVLKPGGRLVLSTPNVLNLNSRWRFLATGFATLFNPLSLSSIDVVHTSGHIHPVSYYYLALALLRAGATDVHVHFDRFKRSALGWYLVTWPVLLAGNAWFHLRLSRKQRAVLDENRRYLREMQSHDMLTSRSIVVEASRPA